jgi:lipoprotein NlpD
MLRVLLCLIVIQLTACSSQHKPAPVIEIYGSIPASKYTKSSINTEEYTVKKGETLYSIAWRSSSDIRKIASLNNLKHPYKIFPGQKLSLSSKSSTTSNSNASKQKPNNYSVQVTEKVDKKPVAQNKKQAYGGSASVEKSNKQSVVQVPSFSKKIRKWLWPASGKIINDFSTSQQGNKGIDIAGRKGDRIIAAADGIIVYAGNALRGYGNLVIIKHNDDYLSAYAHNNAIYVKEQQVVKAGQKIASMGDTDTNNVMLHFEVRFRGKSVNPIKYLPKK